MTAIEGQTCVDTFVAAWNDYRIGVIDDAQDRPRRTSNERSIQASKLLIKGRAETLGGVIAKLRMALWTSPGDPQVDAAVLSGEPLSRLQSVFDEALAGDDCVNEVIWTAITSLERMAGLA